MSNPTIADPAANLKAIEARLAAASAESGRSRAKVLIVTKTQPAERILPLLEAGWQRFGENRVQEAMSKWPALRARYPSAELHLVGPLQTNKARDAVALFDVIQSLDRERLAQILAEETAKQGKRARLYVQVNTGEEPQKAGVAPAAADAFIARCRDEWDLPIEGLMCIPPEGEAPAPHFTLLAKIARRNGLAHLSMGMSGDYLIAASLGATLVRIGTGVFGARET